MDIKSLMRLYNEVYSHKSSRSTCKSVKKVIKQQKDRRTETYFTLIYVWNC